MQRLSPRFRSQEFFLSKICGDIFPQIYRDLYGEVMLEPIRMGTNMAAGKQQKHLSLSFAAKAYIFLSRNSKTSTSDTLTVQIAKFLQISHFFKTT